MFRSSGSAAPSRIGVTALTILAVALAGVSPAAAVPPSVPSVNVFVDPSLNEVDAGGRHFEDFGASTPAARRLFLSAKTRTLKIRSAEFVDNSADFSIRCDATDARGASILVAQYVAPATTSDTVRLQVRAGAVPLRNGRQITVTCFASANQLTRESTCTSRRT